MACIYGVLLWLEGKNLIPPSSIVSMHEGNISITYKASFTGTGENSQLSYNEAYNYYMGFLLPLPPVGAHKMIKRDGII
jgi:hypothetical protein